MNLRHIKANTNSLVLVPIIKIKLFIIKSIINILCIPNRFLYYRHRFCCELIPIKNRIQIESEICEI